MTENAAREKWMGLAGRLAAFCLGAMFLVSGGAKVADLNSFIREFAAYGIITGQPWTLICAWGLLAFELALGAALVFGWRLKLSLPAAAGLMILFIVAVLWAWRAGTTEDCGCFGALVKRSPSEAMVEDVFILGLVFFAWWAVKTEPGAHQGARLVAVALAAAVGICGPFALGFSPSKVLAPPPPGTPLPAVVLGAPNAPDLNKGEYLLFIMETECDHCRANIPAVNDIARTPGLARVVAICPDDPDLVSRFVSRFAPPFSLYMVSRKEFMDLLGSAETTPRFLLVKDGRVLKHWDGEAPPVSELAAK